MIKCSLLKRVPLKSGVLCLLLASGTPFLFAAPNPVSVESLSTEAQPLSGQSLSESQAIIEEDLDSRDKRIAGGETQYQLQVLQQEVQELRGLLEEFQYALEQMRSTQDDRYLELDSRFQTLTRQISNRPPNTKTLPKSDPVAAEGRVASGLDEKTLYETAIELIRSRQYELAITQLQTVIARYPEGPYAPNAYYWLGEVYAAKPDPDYENARKALAQVITYFPEHRKVPDAAFKLGKVYHLMGDCDRATELLTQVIDQQKSKAVSKLAEVYLRERLTNCQ